VRRAAFWAFPLSLFQFFKPLLLFRHCRCQCGDFAFALLCQLACRTPSPAALLFLCLLHFCSAPFGMSQSEMSA